jgi:hypothetical protein
MKSSIACRATATAPPPPSTGRRARSTRPRWSCARYRPTQRCAPCSGMLSALRPSRLAGVTPSRPGRAATGRACLRLTHRCRCRRRTRCRGAPRTQATASDLRRTRRCAAVCAYGVRRPVPAHAPCTCTLHMHTAHAHCTCTLHMHTAHAHCTCTLHMHTAHAPQRPATPHHSWSWWVAPPLTTASAYTVTAYAPVGGDGWAGGRADGSSGTRAAPVAPCHHCLHARLTCAARAVPAQMFQRSRGASPARNRHTSYNMEECFDRDSPHRMAAAVSRAVNSCQGTPSTRHGTPTSGRRAT